MDTTTLQPDKLYLWKMKAPAPCAYCGEVFGYYTAVVYNEELGERKHGDGKCAGLHHPLVVSYPDHFISGIDPIDPETIGVDLATCYNLSDLWNQWATVRWEEAKSDGSTVPSTMADGVAGLAEAGVSVTITEEPRGQLH